MKDEAIVTCVAMGSVVALEIVNLVSYKIDGAILTGAIGVICTLAGIRYQQYREKKGKR